MKTKKKRQRGKGMVSTGREESRASLSRGLYDSFESPRDVQRSHVLLEVRGSDVPFGGNESLIIPFLEETAFCVTPLPVLERILAPAELETTHSFQQHESHSETVGIRALGFAVTTRSFQAACCSSGWLTQARQQQQPRKAHHDQHSAVRCKPCFLDETLPKFSITPTVLACDQRTAVCLSCGNRWGSKPPAETSCSLLHTPNTGGGYSLPSMLF